ncbi:MAG: radical SAM protein, partial [Candidatus Omnitrophica bacterium]|nr:radical SAM protein [Candidatus Omnitrophota bacterium]
SHVSCLPEEALAFCDSVVVGEAEGVWEALLADYENNDLKRVYQGAATEEQYDRVHQFLMQAPAHEVVDNLVTTYGCKFNCNFCAVGAITRGRTRCKPVSQVVELIRRFRPKRRYFHFLDSNMFTNPAYARELFRAFIPLNIKWRGCSSLDIVTDEECLRLAKASGCVGLLIGYEINQASPEKKQGGKLRLAEQYLEYTRRLKNAGIDVKGHFIFGYDSDRWKTLLDYWKFCFNVFPGHTGFCILTPLPGTRLFDELLSEGRIMNVNWHRFTTLQIVFRTKNLDFKKVGFVFPFIMLFFYLTTSRNGWLLLVSLVCLGRIILKILAIGNVMY